jgi:hypothetical protein
MRVRNEARAEYTAALDEGAPDVDARRNAYMAALDDLHAYGEAHLRRPRPPERDYPPPLYASP